MTFSKKKKRKLRNQKTFGLSFYFIHFFFLQIVAWFESSLFCWSIFRWIPETREQRWQQQQCIGTFMCNSYFQHKRIHYLQNNAMQMKIKKSRSEKDCELNFMINFAIRNCFTIKIIYLHCIPNTNATSVHTWFGRERKKKKINKIIN